MDAAPKAGHADEPRRGMQFCWAMDTGRDAARTARRTAVFVGAWLCFVRRELPPGRQPASGCWESQRRSARRDGAMASLADGRARAGGRGVEAVGGSVVEDERAGSRRALHKSIRGSCTGLEACWTMGWPQVTRTGGRVDWDPGCEGKEPRAVTAG
jgi:hypothetical protein